MISDAKKGKFDNVSIDESLLICGSLKFYSEAGWYNDSRT